MPGFIYDVCVIDVFDLGACVYVCVYVCVCGCICESTLMYVCVCECICVVCLNHVYVDVYL